MYKRQPLGRSEVRFPQPETKGRRELVDLNAGWQTALLPEAKGANVAAQQEVNTAALSWKTVNVPHNWDDYYGYRQLTHGNLHGTAQMCIRDSGSVPKLLSVTMSFPPAIPCIFVFLQCLPEHHGIIFINKKEPCIWLAFYRKSRNAVPFLLTPSRSQVGVLNR